MNAATIKRQHKEILGIIDEIAAQLYPLKLQTEAFQVHLKLGMLSGKLMLHLNTEDRYIYPKLLQDSAASAITKQFIDEMAEIANAFTGFKAEFNSVSKIKENPESFIVATKNILSALKKRIAKEEAQLLPLLK